MRPPVTHPTFSPTKWAIALLILVLWTALLMRCSAATVVFGGSNGFNHAVAPFGTTSDGTAAYVGEFQQIYASNFFPTESLISQIAFSGARIAVSSPQIAIAGVGLNSPGDVSWVLSIGLGVTTRTPANPGVGFAPGAATVFSGTLVAHLTPLFDEWDLVIDLPTPFRYDTSLGNLLLDVTTNSATGPVGITVLFDRKEHTSDRARLEIRGTSVSASANDGLATQFTVTPVPEPATAGMLLLGAALCVPRRVRGKVAAAVAAAFTMLASDSPAATITFGASSYQQMTPFGKHSSTNTSYPEGYQQIYLGSKFEGPCWITRIQFMDFDSPVTWDAQYNLSIGLMFTTNSPSSVGETPEFETTPVFSEPLTAHITVEPNDWDLSIPLTTPFFYDPAAGNLRLYAITNSLTGSPGTGITTGFAGADAQDDIGSFIRTRSGMGARPNRGLFTQFTVTPVPEPATAGLLLLGAVLWIPRRVRAALRSS